MSEPKTVISLLRAFEAEALEHADGLSAVDREGRTELRDAISVFLAGNASETDDCDSSLSEHNLLAKLKIRAQQELCGEQELLLVEQAGKLAGAFTKLARQSSEIENAKLLSLQREDFVATLTHDLKSPLIGANRLLGLIAAGQLGTLEQKTIDLLQKVIDSNCESLCLIQNLNDVYRYESDPGQIQLQKCELVPIVKAAFQEMQTFSMQRKIRATLSTSAKVRVRQLDPLAIRRLLDNLLGNAVKFTEPGGSLDVRVFEQESRAIIEIQDDGLGIADNERHHLFQRFSQGFAGRARRGGSGLGLYLCKQIADAHGATIESLNSEKGALFRVSLPQ